MAKPQPKKSVVIYVGHKKESHLKPFFDELDLLTQKYGLKWSLKVIAPQE